MFFLVRYVLAPCNRIKRFNGMERETYQRPEMELLDICVERGFAVSVESEVEGFDREEWNE